MIAQANADAAAALVSALAARVRHAVVSPGSRNTPIVLALDAHPQIETHVVLDERVAGFVALGLVRATGRPVILSCTSGSAGAHYLPAVVEAFESSAPLIVITADRPPELHGHAAPQTTPQGSFFGQHVIDREVLPLPDEASAETFAALGLDALEVAAASSRPVHLNAPFREPLWMPDAHYPVTEAPEPPPIAPVAADPSVAVSHLRAARGLIVAGPRDRQDRLAEEPSIAWSAHALGQALGWPVLADVTSGTRYHEGPPPITGYDTLLRSEPFARQMRPDCALMFGRPSTSKALNQWLARERVPVVVVGEEPSHRDPGLEVRAELRGALGPSLRALAEALPAPQVDSEWLIGWREAEARFVEHNRSDRRWWEGALARRLVTELPAGALLHVSSSMPVRDVDAFAGPLQRAVTVTANRGVNGIDGVTSTAIGQARGWRHGPTVALLGDLAFLHDLGAARLAASEAVPLTVVVVNNGGGRIFDFLPIHAHSRAFDRYFVTDQGVRLETLTGGLGARFERVDDGDGFAEALARSLESGRFSVIEAVFDGDANRAEHEVFHRAVTEAIE